MVDGIYGVDEIDGFQYISGCESTWVAGCVVLILFCFQGKVNGFNNNNNNTSMVNEEPPSLTNSSAFFSSSLRAKSDDLWRYSGRINTIVNEKIQWEAGVEDRDEEGG